MARRYISDAIRNNILKKWDLFLNVKCLSQKMSLLLIEDSISDKRVLVEWIIIWAIHFVPYHPAECFYWPQTYALCGKPTLCAFIIFPVFSHLDTPNRSKRAQGLTGSKKHTRGAARPRDIRSRAAFILHVRGCPIWLKMGFREFVHTATLMQIITFDDMCPFGKPPNIDLCASDPYQAVVCVNV